MVMFGNRGNTAPTLSGRFPMPGPIGGYGGGTFNMDGTPATTSDGGFPQSQMAPQGPGKLDRFLGVASDVGDILRDDPGIYEATQNRQASSLQHQADQQARRDDWIFQQDYERTHPKPVNNDTANDYAFWQGKLSPAEFEQWKQGRIDPVVSVPLPNGQIYTGPRSQMGAAMGGGMSPKPAVSGPRPGTIEEGFRFKGGNPADPNAWEPVGGGASNGAGNFHIPSGNPLSPYGGR